MITQPRRQLSFWHWALALLVAFAAALLYLHTLQPTLGGMFNSEEYQYAAYSLSLVHPTGYPLFLMLGKLWVTLVPFGNVAYRMNLFSALWASLAAALTFAIILQLTRQPASGVIGALVFATNAAVWQQASVAEVDTFTAFLAGAMILSLLLWRAGRVRLEGCGFIYGLALTHHRTSIFYAPGVLLFVILTQPRLLQAPKTVARTLLLLLLPWLAYLYVPLRASTAPEPLNDAGSMLMYVLGGAAGSGNLIPPGEWAARFSLIYHTYLWDWFTWLGAALSVVGYVSWRRARLPELDQPATKVLLGLTFLLLTLFTIPYGLADIHRYLLVPVMILAILIGAGSARMAQYIRELGKNSRLTFPSRAFLALAILGLPVRALIVNFPEDDFSQNYRVYQFWNEIFSLPIEPGAVIIGNWGEVNAARYMQRVEGRRTDLQAIAVSASQEELSARVEQVLASGQVAYLTPGDPEPDGDYHYGALGPLLRVSAEPGRKASSPPVVFQQRLGTLTIMGYGVTHSLEPNAARTLAAIEPGESARLALYWHVESGPLADYKVRVRLLNEMGHRLWQNVEPPLHGWYPTSRWVAGEFVSDVHGVFIPPGTPPGDYEVQIALVDSNTNAVLESAQTLKAIRVLRAQAPLADQIFVRQRTSITFGGLQMIGHTAGGTRVQKSTPLEFAVAWSARESLREDYALRFRLADENGNVWQEQIVPVVRALPTHEWQQGEGYKEYYTLPLTSTAPTGLASLYLSVLDASGRSVAPSPGTDPEITLFTFSVTP